VPDQPGVRAAPPPQPLFLTGYHGKPTVATLLIATYDAGQRLRRAVKALLACWGAMVVSVFLPIAHLVLVPSFFGAGIWQFFKRLGQAERVRGAHGRCPDCGAEQDFDLSSRLRFPQAVQCGSCQRGLTLATADGGNS
jgi:hypothetical protein